ncbi:hypothetical protein CYMTET_21917 [Cymbomonas tetramitiformis]|uniref:Aquaporin n=1 Tax=Cymbomonas tetramitiformis TaxID=36881 RepID=A0AAE0G137_9CHLO|nr:hypothetical protein CYMTET_21917 [Cymbomonas tetramitiformis]
MFRGDIQGELEESEQRKAMSQFAAEAFGTYFIVVIGCGSVCSAVLTGALQGLWQVAVVWAFGVSLAIYATGSISGAHLNPSVSFAFALLRPWDFPWSKMFLYWAAQIFGAVLGGATNYLIFKELIVEFERVNGIERGSSSSVMSAMIFGEYYPNPGLQYSVHDGELETGDRGWSYHTVSTATALGVEAWGTGILMFFILALTDPHNKTLVTKDFAPFFIGFTVAVLIAVYAPITQAGFNPARDLGPRIVAYFAGWGEIAIPGPRGGFWIYVLGPLIGAPCGGALYDFLFAASVRAS